jgi:hypothetical protein
VGSAAIRCLSFVQVERSVLWLLYSSDDAAVNLRRTASAHGVGGERIVFARKMAKPDHLARHALADVFVDTLECAARTRVVQHIQHGAYCAVNVCNVLHTLGTADTHMHITGRRLCSAYGAAGPVYSPTRGRNATRFGTMIGLPRRSALLQQCLRLFVCPAQIQRAHDCD